MHSDQTVFDGKQTNRVLITIIALCCVVEIALMAADYGVFPVRHLRGLAYQNGGFWSGLLHDWQPNFATQPATMFVTYGFLHAGILHLIMNMVTLWSIGRAIIARIGEVKFSGLYLASLLGGGIGFGALSDAVAPMVGASGALFGLIAAWLVWEAHLRRSEGASLFPVFRSVLMLVLLNVVLWWATSGQLAWETHLGGAVFGGIAGWFIRERYKLTQG